MTTHEKIFHCCSEVKYEHIGPGKGILITAIFEKETITTESGTLYFAEARLWENLSEIIKSKLKVFAIDIEKATKRNRMDQVKKLNEELAAFDSIYGVMIR